MLGGGVASKGRIDVSRFVIARLTRLWIVLIPALVATAGIDYVISIHAPDVLAGAYWELWSSGPKSTESYSVSFGTFISNALFLQTVTAPVYGTNGPLWSLANEFWYYTIFAMLMLAIGGRAENSKAAVPSRILFSVLCLCLMLWLPVPMMWGFAVWLMGVAAYFFLNRLTQPASCVVLFLGLVMFAASILYSKSPDLKVAIWVSSDLCVGLSFAVLIIGLTNVKTRAALPNRLTAVSALLSNFSYSLYLIHFPVVALIGVVFYGRSQCHPDAVGYFQFFAWLLVLLAIGYGFYYCFERHTGVTRKAIERFMGRMVRT